MTGFLSAGWGAWLPLAGFLTVVWFFVYVTYTTGPKGPHYDD